MEGSDKGFSPSMYTKPSSASKSSHFDAGEADENDQMGAMRQSPKKQPMKHFMAPTISAVSKASLPRKKILAERNESAETQQPSTPNPNNSERYSPIQSRLGVSDNEQNTSFSDSSSKPYDPVNNYLSPRPRFLRYRPNRHREIFLRQENGTGKEKEDDGLGDTPNVCIKSSERPILEAELLADDAHSDSVSSPQEGSDEQENEQINVSESGQDDDDGEIDEFENETFLSLKGVLKFLLVLVLLVSSTLYIASMNSPTPSPTLQAIRSIQDKIRGHVLDTVNDKTSQLRSGFLGQSGRGNLVGDNEFREEVKMFEPNLNGLVEEADGWNQMTEAQNGENEEPFSYISDEANKDFKLYQETGSLDGNEGYDAELEKKKEVSVGFLEEEAAENEDTYHQNIEKSREVSELMKGTEILEKNEEVSKGFHEEEAAKNEEVFERTGNEISNNAEQFDTFEDYKNPSTPAKLYPYASEYEFHNGLGLESSQAEDKDEIEETSEDFLDEGEREEVIESKMDEIEGMASSDEVTIKTEPILGTATGFFVFFTASSFLGFHLMGKKTSGRQSMPKEKLVSESEVAEKNSSGGTLVHMEKEKSEKAESSSTLIQLKKEASKELGQSGAPMVELLGEFVVGEVSSSHKSCSTKSKMMEQIETGMTSYIGEKTALTSKAHEASSRVLHQPSASEFSTMDSPSYGSFTAEKNILKKEEGNREVRAVVTTPVRRSSRIRNRAVMSP